MSERFTTQATAVLHGGPLDGGEKSLATESDRRRGPRPVQKELAILRAGLAHVYLLTSSRRGHHAGDQRYHYTHQCTFRPFTGNV